MDPFIFGMAVVASLLIGFAWGRGQIVEQAKLLGYIAEDEEGNEGWVRRV